LDLDFTVKNVWTTVGLGLSLKNSGLDPNRKIRQSAHLWQGSLQQKACSGIYCMGYFSIFATRWRQ